MSGIKPQRETQNTIRVAGTRGNENGWQRFIKPNQEREVEQRGRKRQRFDSYWHQHPASNSDSTIYLGYRHNTQGGATPHTPVLSKKQSRVWLMQYFVQRLVYKLQFRLNFQFSGEKICRSHHQSAVAANILRPKSPLFCFPGPRIFQGQDEGCVGRNTESVQKKNEFTNPAGGFDSLLHPSASSRWQSSACLPLGLCIVITIIIIHIIFMHISHQ